MNKEFIAYEQALEMKELGFNEPCFAFYGIDGDYILGIDEVKFDTINNYDFNSRTSKESNNCSAPLYQQAFRWFREKHDLIHIIDLGSINNTWSYWIYVRDFNWINGFNTYEEAELACLKKLIEIVKNK